jgi:general secretion pathway protein D
MDLPIASRIALCRFVLCGMLAVIAGCAEQQLRDESQAQMAAGHYKQALQTLQRGIQQYPESTALRNALFMARSQVETQALDEAAALQGSGRLDEAETSLREAQSRDPENARVSERLADISIERRMQSDLNEARLQFEKGELEAASAVIERALKTSPRQSGLLELRRRVEDDQRRSQSRIGQPLLAEARPISLDFRDANLRSILDVVSRSSGVNFVIDRDVRADTKVTIYVRDARLEDALDMIVGSNQLSKKVVDDKTVMIYPNTPEKQRDYQEQVVRVFYLASSDAKGASAFLKAMLKVGEPFVDERSNMVALRGDPETIQLAERLISLYDSADPEVLLEIEVLEVNATRLTNLGVQFPTSVTFTPIGPVNSSSAPGQLTLGNIRRLTPDNILLGLGAVTINLQRQVGDFSTLANPRIRVKNREKARVLVGDKIPVITTTTATGGFVSDSVNYLDVGLKLDVEPVIYADDDVSIKIGLEVSSLGSSVTTSSGTLAYQISTRNADTSLRLHDGETQLLAGLISKDESLTSSRLPGVGDLPILGRLFSSDLTNNKRNELVLAITPHILRNARHSGPSETELWIGTDAMPHLRPVGGLRASRPAAAGSAPAAHVMSNAEIGTATSQPPSEASLVQATPRTKLSWAGPKNGKVGDEFEVGLMLDTTVVVRGLPVELLYDARLLQMVSATPGDMFRQGGADPGFSRGEAGPPGDLHLSLMRNGVDGVTGSGTAYKLRFKARAAGEARITVIGTQAQAMTVGVLPVAVPPAYVLQVH